VSIIARAQKATEEDNRARFLKKLEYLRDAVGRLNPAYELTAEEQDAIKRVYFKVFISASEETGQTLADLRSNMTPEAGSVYTFLGKCLGLLVAEPSRARRWAGKTGEALSSGAGIAKEKAGGWLGSAKEKAGDWLGSAKEKAGGLWKRGKEKLGKRKDVAEQSRKKPSRKKAGEEGTTPSVPEKEPSAQDAIKSATAAVKQSKTKDLSGNIRALGKLLNKVSELNKADVVLLEDALRVIAKKAGSKKDSKLTTALETARQSGTVDGWKKCLQKYAGEFAKSQADKKTIRPAEEFLKPADLDLERWKALLGQLIARLKNRKGLLTNRYELHIIGKVSEKIKEKFPTAKKLHNGIVDLLNRDTVAAIAVAQQLGRYFNVFEGEGLPEPEPEPDARLVELAAGAASAERPDLVSAIMALRDYLAKAKDRVLVSSEQHLIGKVYSAVADLLSERDKEKLRKAYAGNETISQVKEFLDGCVELLEKRP